MKPVLAAVAGLGLGIGVGALMFGGEPAPATVAGPEAPAVQRVTHTVVESADTSDLERQLRECTSQLRMQERVVADHEGAWQDWPAQVQAALEPDVFEERAAAVELGRLDRLDCAEFPCVATFEIDPDTVPFSAEDPNIPLNHLDELGQLIGQQMGIDGEVLVYPVQVHGDQLETVVTFAVLPSGYDSDAMRARLRYRMKSEAETALCIHGACD